MNYRRKRKHVVTRLAEQKRPLSASMALILRSIFHFPIALPTTAHPLACAAKQNISVNYMMYAGTDSRVSTV